MRTLAIALCTIFLGLSPAAALAAPGDLDPFDAFIEGEYAAAAVRQPDGGLIVVGKFTTVQGVSRLNVARIMPNGVIDLTFDPRPDGEVVCVALQPDGKIVIGGLFTSLQPNGGTTVNRTFCARLLPNGTVDPTFYPNPDGTVYALALLPDGRMLLGGEFSSVQPGGPGNPAALKLYVLRLLANGAIDPNFDPRPDSSVRSLAVQTDGKILLGGFFFSLRPNGFGPLFARKFVARVLDDGSVDAGFDPSANSVVYSVLEQADGKVLLAGNFTTLQPNGAPTAVTRNYVARVLPDGSLDTTFNVSANNFASGLALQADGKILLGGNFATLQPAGDPTPTSRRYVARLLPSGALDAFDPRTDPTVFGANLEPDGRVLLAGYFSNLQPNGAASSTPRARLARLVNDAATQTLSAVDGTQVLWSRGGSAPDVGGVTFELSTNGGANYTQLGLGVRVGTTASWQLTGLTLPTSGMLRARGYASGGRQNGSRGLIEQVATFSGPEIVVQQPVGNTLVSGSSTVTIASPGTASASRTLTVRNIGESNLTLGTITKSGPDAALFTVDASGMVPNLPPGGTTTFNVSFARPTPGTASASISLANNDADEAPFVIALSGRALSFTADSDGDGMNDAAELQLAALGFDYEVSQPALVTAYYANANGAGLYTLSQVQTLNADVPLLVRNATSGQFKLTLSLQKTTNLNGFSAFPFSAPQISVNPQGEIEFTFTLPDNSAFLRLQAR